MSEEQNKDSPPLTDDNQQQGPPLNNPSTDEAIVPVIEKSGIINHTSENQDMEVHHHAHDPAAPHHKKNWKSYFWEFLMLFLAVFCGFFAEYQLEHTIEKERAKEYAISFKEDLIKDTIVIEKIISILNNDITASDSLNYYLENERTKKAIDLQRIYKFNLSSLGGFSFSLTDRTSSQLKNSGGMRLLTNQKVVKGILDYWETGAILEDISTNAATMRQQAREKTYLIFDNRYYSANSDANGIREVSADARLLTNNYLQLAELRNRLNHFKNTLKGPFLKGLIYQNKQAHELIKLIEKEYE